MIVQEHTDLVKFTQMKIQLHVFCALFVINHEKYASFLESRDDKNNCICDVIYAAANTELIYHQISDGKDRVKML